MTTYYGFGATAAFRQFYDLIIQAADPGIVLQGTETGAVWAELREIAGVTYLTKNAAWSGSQWLPVDVTIPAYAFVQQNYGDWNFFQVPPGVTPITWDAVYLIASISASGDVVGLTGTFGDFTSTGNVTLNSGSVAGYMIASGGITQGLFAPGAVAGTFNLLNVKDYGAVGNGAVDDTAAISAAVAAWNTGSVSGASNALYFPPGIYQYNQTTAGPITVALAGNHLFGAGMYASIIRFSGTTGDGIQNNVAGGVRLHSIGLASLTMTTGAALTHGVSGTSLEARNVNFAGPGSGTGHAGYRLTPAAPGPNGIRVHDCIFTGWGAGVHLAPTSTGTVVNAKFSNNQYVTNTAYGVNLASLPSVTALVGVVFESSYFSGNTTLPLNFGGGVSSYGSVVGGVPTLYVRSSTGYEPPALTPPSIPASTTALVNPFAFDVDVYVAGGTVTVIAIGNAAGTNLGSTGVTSGHFVLKAGYSITLTYSVAPTWVWIGRP